MLKLILSLTLLTMGLALNCQVVPNTISNAGPALTAAFPSPFTYATDVLVPDADNDCDDYITRSGDTCVSIVKDNRIELDDFIHAIFGIPCGFLPATSRVCIPKPPGTHRECQLYWRVFSGDSCYIISQETGVSLNLIRFVNPGLRCSRLVPGDYICFGTTFVV